MSKESITLPDMSDYKIKKDRYRQERGNTSEMLEILCSSCESELFVYQKDGPGNLIRCYVDRIAWLPEVSDLEKNNSDDNKKMSALKCPSCENVIGVPMVYAPENRSAYRMIKGSFIKRKYQASKENKQISE